jgi:hypothetical protein
MNRVFNISSIIFFIFVSIGLNTYADNKNHAALMDGISVVVNFSEDDQLGSIPIFISDIELLARLFAINKYGGSWQSHKIDNEMRFNARKAGTIIILLSHVARLMGEEVNSLQYRQLMEKIEQKAGGPEVLNSMLAAVGVDRHDLNIWIANILLANVQLEYLFEKNEPVSDAELKKMFMRGNHPFKGTEWTESRRAYKQLVKNQQLLQSVNNWLKTVLMRTDIYFAR